MTFVVSFVVLTVILVCTFLYFSEPIDLSNFLYALIHIALISVVTTALTIFIRKRGYIAHVLFGATVGSALGFAYATFAFWLTK